MLQRVGKVLIKAGIFAFILLGLLLSANTFTYLNFDTQYRFLRLKQEAIATGWYLPAYYAHIFIGGIVLTVGFFQFSKRIRKRLPRIHRAMGYIYFLGILLFAAPGGMVMSFFINRGPIVFTSFVVQCCLWMLFTYLSFKKIIEGKVAEHEMWVMRSFALTLAAITLRLYIFGASYWFDLSNEIAYGVFSWLSWVPNLLVAEVLIRMAKEKSNSQLRTLKFT